MLVGCGLRNGSWVLELALRKPSWHVTGLDKNGEAVHLATLSKEKLGLASVSFVCDDFLRYEPDRAYDVVLSVASADYLVDEGNGHRAISCISFLAATWRQIAVVGTSLSR